MIREKRSYVAGDMCDSKLKLSILAADGNDGVVLIKARTELAAVDLENGKIRKADTVGFTEDMAHDIVTEGLEFSRFSKTEGVSVDTVTVRSTSLDYCYHTNNIEYVRFMLNTYDSEFFKAHDPEGLEIHYLSQIIS